MSTTATSRADPDLASCQPTVAGSPLLGATRLAGYAIWTIALMPLQFVAVRARLPLAGRLPRFYHRTCCALLGIRIEALGRRSRARPTLFVANHVSYLDIAVYGSLLEGSFVAKREVAQWPFFGLLAKLQRSVFIERKIGGARGSIAEMQRRLRGGDSLILFPEGTSGDGNTVLPFHSALLAAAATMIDGAPVPVQPVTIAYTRLDGLPIGRHLRPFFAWYGDMDLAGHLWQLAGLGQATVTVVFHEPVTLPKLGSRKALRDHCHAVIAKGHCEALSGLLQRGRGRRRRLGGARRTPKTASPPA